MEKTIPETPSNQNNRIIIGSDHGGYDMKCIVDEYLKTVKRLEVTDVGCTINTRVDYPDIAETLCKRIQSGEFDKGILMCGTGIGISIAANKMRGIRCALGHDHYTVKMCRQHNDANILAFGGRTTGPEVAKEMIDIFLEEKYLGAWHQQRLDKISKLEEKSSL